MRTTSLLIGSLSLVLLAGACADDPVTFSEPVTINLKVNSDKVVNDSITTEKGISTENANPYGAFVADAQAALGADPSRIDLGHVNILLAADTDGPDPIPVQLSDPDECPADHFISLNIDAQTRLGSANGISNCRRCRRG